MHEVECVEILRDMRPLLKCKTFHFRLHLRQAVAARISRSGSRKPNAHKDERAKPHDFQIYAPPRDVISASVALGRKPTGRHQST